MTEYVCSSSDTSSGEDFIEKSLMHVIIKTVPESTEEEMENHSSRGYATFTGENKPTWEWTAVI